jgi:hypothetical protein
MRLELFRFHCLRLLSFVGGWSEVNNKLVHSFEGFLKVWFDVQV